MPRISLKWFLRTFLGGFLGLATLFASTLQGAEESLELAAPTPCPAAVIQVLGTTTLRTNQGSHLQFSPDGTKLAVDNCVSSQIWDVKSGELLFKYSPRDAHSADPAPICFLDDGKRLLSVNRKQGVMVCDWERQPPRMRHFQKSLQPPYERLLATSADGLRLLVIGNAAQRRSDQALSVRDTETGEKLLELPSVEWEATAISPSGKLMAFAESSQDKKPVAIEVWDVAEKRKRYTLGPFERSVDRLVFAPTDDVLYLTDDFGQVESREIATNQRRRLLLPGGRYPTAAQTKQMALSRDGRRLAVCAYESPITVVDVESGNVLRQFRWVTDRRVEALALSPDGAVLAAAGDIQVTELWDVMTGKPLLPTEGAKTLLFSLVAAPDGRSIATLDMRRLLLWSPNGEIVAKHPAIGFSFGGGGHDIGLQFGDEGRLLLTLNGIGKIEARDAKTLLPSFTVKRKTSLPTMLTMSPGLEATACVLSGNAVKFQPGPLTVPGQPAVDYGKYPGTKERITALAFSHDAAWLACGDKKGELAIWSARRERRQHEIRIPAQGQAVTALAIRNDGQVAAVGTEDGVLRLWNLESKRVDRSWTDLRWNPTALAFDPAQGRLAVGLSNGSLRILDVASGNDAPLSPAARAVPDRIESVHRLAWSPAGDRLAVGFGTGRVWFLRIDDKSLPVEAQEHVAPITAINWLQNGKQVATGDERCVLHVWNPDVAKSQQVLTGTLTPAVGMGIDPRHDKLTVYTREGVVYVKRPPGGFGFTHEDRHDTLHLTDELDRFAMAPDGRTLAATTETAVLVWDDLRAQESREFPLTPDWGHDLEFSRDSSLLGIKEEGLSLRRVADGRQIAKIVPYEESFSPVVSTIKSDWNEFHFSPVEDVVTVRKRNQFKFFDVKNGRFQRQWEAPLGDVLCFEFTPDGTQVAILGNWPGQEFLLVESLSGLVLHRLLMWPNSSNKFALLNEGREMASADSTSLGVVWTLRPDIPEPVGAPSTEQLRLSWDDLAEKDGGKVYRALWRFAEAGDSGVDFLGKVLPAIKPSKESLLVRVRDHVRDLGRTELRAEAAMQRLVEMRPAADAELLWHLDNAPSDEVRAKIATVLEAKLQPPTTDELRWCRATNLLGRIGTASAKATLEKLAMGPPESLVADSARSALRYLAKKRQPQ